MDGTQDHKAYSTATAAALALPPGIAGRRRQRIPTPHEPLNWRGYHTLVITLLLSGKYASSLGGLGSETLPARPPLPSLEHPHLAAMAQASPGRLARLGSRAERVLAGVGLLTVGGVAVQAAAARKRSSAALPAEGFVLELDLEQGSVVESARPRPLQTLLAGEGGRRKPLELAAVVDALQAAGDDTRVVGLLALLGGAAGLGLAQTQELCDAVSAFR